jgi:hypothetical protein
LRAAEANHTQLLRILLPLEQALGFVQLAAHLLIILLSLEVAVAVLLAAVVAQEGI